ncbi:MAG TPA: hypothetical protein DCF68_04770 [Cyanothece sp. UBA12306]|nr:hypothetical protein [Cyanothece sp. UBA12306]
MNQKISKEEYPSRQPFPNNPVVSLVDEINSNFVSKDRFITYEYSPFIEAKKKLNYYLFDKNIDNLKEGLVLGVKGDFGSGKTHFLKYLIHYIDEQNFSLKQIYVKVESSDFLALYRRIIRQIEYELIQEVNTKWLSLSAQIEAEKHEITKPAVSRLKQDPNSVYEYLNQCVLSPTEVKGRSLKWVQNISNYQEFLHGVSYLNDPLLGRDAYDWFLGKELSSNTLSKLGISRPIQNSEMAAIALKFIVTIFKEVQQPLLLYIDQIERLLLNTDVEIKEKNRGILHSLMELFVREQSVLCLAGVTDAWDELPKDFLDRLTLPPIELPSLSLEQTLNLIKIYLDFVKKYISSSVSIEFKPYTCETEIYPYTKAAVREIVRISHGNIRSILRLCYRTFEESAPSNSIITPEDVKKVSRSLKEYFDEKTVLEEIKTFLREANLSFVEQPQLPENVQLNIAIPDQKNPLAFIEVSEAIFGEDEASQAIRSLEYAEVLRKNFPNTQLVLIITGYLSSEVQQKLQGNIFNHYLVYTLEKNKFKKDFSQIIISIKSQRDEHQEKLSQSNNFEMDKLQQEILSIRGYLQQVLEERQRQEGMQQLQIQDFLKYQETVREKELEFQRLRWEQEREDKHLERKWRQRQIYQAYKYSIYFLISLFSLITIIVMFSQIYPRLFEKNNNNTHNMPSKSSVK